MTPGQGNGPGRLAMVNVPLQGTRAPGTPNNGRIVRIVRRYLGEHFYVQSWSTYRTVDHQVAWWVTALPDDPPLALYVIRAASWFQVTERPFLDKWLIPLGGPDTVVDTQDTICHPVSRLPDLIHLKEL